MKIKNIIIIGLIALFLVAMVDSQRNRKEYIQARNDITTLKTSLEKVNKQKQDLEKEKESMQLEIQKLKESIPQ